MSIFITLRYSRLSNFKALANLNLLQETTIQRIDFDPSRLQSAEGEKVCLKQILKDIITSIYAIEANTSDRILNDFDLLHLTGVSLSHLKTKAEELLANVLNNKQPEGLELFTLGALIGEYNTLHRFANSLLLHQQTKEKAQKANIGKQIKTQTYLKLSKEIFCAIKNLGFANNDWAIISGVDIFFKTSLDSAMLIEKKSSSQKIAKYLNIEIGKGKPNSEMLKLRDKVVVFLNREYSSDIYELYSTFYKSEEFEYNNHTITDSTDANLSKCLGVLHYLLKYELRYDEEVEPLHVPLIMRLSAKLVTQYILSHLKSLIKISGSKSLTDLDEFMYSQSIYNEIRAISPAFFSQPSNCCLTPIESQLLELRIKYSFNGAGLANNKKVKYKL